MKEKQLTDSHHSFPVQRWRSKVIIEGRTKGAVAVNR